MTIEIPWNDVYAWMVAHAASPAAAAAHFNIKPSTVRPAVKHEADKPGGGRLAGHPVYGQKTPPAGGADATPVPLDPATAAAIYVPVSTLRPWAKNPRQHGEADAIAAAIIRWGFATPLIARLANQEVITGHGRIAAVLSLPKRRAALQRKADAGDARATAALAAWSAGAVVLATDPDPKLPVRYMDLSEDEAHALALADNQVARATGWDDVALAEVLRDIRARSVPTHAMGWDASALNKITGSMPGAPARRERLVAGERPATRRVTVELYPADAELLRRAIDIAKTDDDPASPEHERTNGRRLGRVCAAFLAARGA